MVGTPDFSFGIGQSAANISKNDTNLMPPVIAAIQNDCTLGEIADALRGVFGEF